MTQIRLPAVVVAYQTVFDRNIGKFEEIFLLLEANLKQVKNYIENTDEIISDKNELIDYIKSLFEDSSNRISVIKLIERKH